MAQPHFPANRGIEMVLLALQVFQVLFLWVHDWIPLGRLNDVAAVRSQDTRPRLISVTVIQSVPWTIGLCFSLLYFRRPYPDWLYGWLVIAMVCSSSGKSAPGGYLIFFDRNRSELLAIKSCSAKRIPSCRRAMEWSQTPRISCFIWRPPPH
jgi:hypothetical protein